MTQTVLITGASGFIGGALVRMLNRVGPQIDYKVIPMVRKPSGLPDEVVLDFESRDFGYKIRKLRPVDAIVHLGAKVDLSMKLIWKNDLYLSNVLATAILARWARTTGAYFVFTSTVMIHGAQTSEVKKDTSPNPDTGYADSKWLAEGAIRIYEPEHLILRLAGVYGNNGPLHLGINKAITQAQNSVVPTLTGDGAGKRNYIYVADLAKLLLFCLKSRITGTHLVAGTEVISIAEMLRLICDAFLPGTQPIRKEGDSGRDQIVEHSKELHWRMKGFEEALRNMKKWHEAEKTE